MQEEMGQMRKEALPGEEEGRSMQEKGGEANNTKVI